MKRKIGSIFTILFLNLGGLELAEASAEKKLSYHEVVALANKNYPQILSYTILTSKLAF